MEVIYLSSISAIVSEMNAIEKLISDKSNEKQELEKMKKDIEEAMNEVNSLSGSVQDTGYTNTFDYVKRNCGLSTDGSGANGSSNNYWIVQDSNGNSYGDVVSFGNALDELSNEVNNVTVSMGNVLTKATEKLEEYKEKIINLEIEISNLQARYSALAAQLEALESESTS